MSRVSIQFSALLYGLPISHSQAVDVEIEKYLQNILMVRMKSALALKIWLILFQCKTIKAKLEMNKIPTFKF